MFLNPQSVLSHVRIPFGARVADFGTGAGHYALLAAEKLAGGGSVYALDAYTPSLESLSREAGRRGLPLYTLHSDLNVHIPLKDNLLHAGIAVNVLHQLSDKQRFINELARVFMPKGEVLVVDWLSSFRNMGPRADAAVAPADAARLFESDGFEVDEMLPAGTHHFAFVARKR